jgi:predicted nucleic acid-binding protein
MSSSASSNAPELPTAVVVDTMIASVWLGQRPSARKERWAPLLSRVAWVLPFTVVAEMRFGANVAGWGPRRVAVLDRLVSRSAVAPPIDEVTDAYVQLRTWCTKAGHGLGAKDHEADRWVGAVAIAANLPVATEDSIFDNVPMIKRASPAVP